ncbi:TfuA-like core domain-containing protein [Sinorhizobium terangae]|uniref:TfuA-like core domain-containing protein n=1 Tax=Sinorhizobium terangae TaxID=110322 RepID=A0A6N7LGX1_SINTE|nr:TfuA-like core domain-containing protein [Sinorhizobium terangae]
MADKVTVFVGPSLGRDRPTYHGLEVDYRPPASQGDLLAAAVDGPKAIVLIDGYFEHVPAVHHKEILWALDKGIAVYGASSIGALRAAELSSFGMIGVGKIFEAFESGELERDDEVALVHGPAEVNYEPLSEPLVNIRSTLSFALESGVVDREIAETLINRTKAAFYPERSFGRLLRDLEHHADRVQAARFASWLPRGRLDQKRMDAVACLARATADILQPPGEHGHSSIGFVFTDAFAQLVRCTAAGLPLGSQVAHRLIRLGSDTKAGLSSVYASGATSAAALAIDRATQGPVPVRSLGETVQFFLEQVPGGDVGTWMKTRNLDLDTLSRILEELARMDRSFEAADELVQRVVHSKLKIS